VRVLGLDPSLSAYGWAIHDDEKTGQKRRLASGHEGTLSTTVPVVRFMHFRSLVGSLIQRYKVDAVGIESPAYQAGPFQRIHFGLMMYSLEAIFERRLDCVLYDPATLKLLAKGDPEKRKGDMSKLDMQRKVQLDTMDPNVIDNNEADAYLIAKFTARFSRFRSGDLDPASLEPSEKRVFLERTRRVKTMTGVVRKRVAHVFRENSRFFNFSQIPRGEVSLPSKAAIKPELLEFLAAVEDAEDKK
jgi:Holliday junction resolvasome RuvABC endonuclease subunit